MKISLEMFTRLPFSLLVTSLALAASALPVDSAELQVLTPDNFEKTVADGVWLIEHFSPYCHHCKAFAPTWEKLVHHYEAMDDPGAHLAQVNCAVHGDLCNAHEVTGYPQMNLYKNGQFVEKFKGARDWDALTSFIDDHAIHSSSKASETQTAPAQHELAPSPIVPNGNGMVQSLDPATFSKLLDGGPLFVKFFAPWCGHCKKLAPIWTQLAAHLRHKLNIAEVNCDEQAALCKSQNVQGYPSLFFYSGGSGSGMHKTDYSGGRKYDQLRMFAEMAIAPAVQDIKDEDYDHYVSESPVVFLLLHSPSDSHTLNQLSQAAHVLLGSPSVLVSTSSSLRSRFAIPAYHADTPVVLAIKDGIPNSYTSLLPLPSGTKEADISAWLLRNRLPSALALGQETFQDVMNAPHHPLVVLVATPPEKVTTVGDKVLGIAKACRRIMEERGVGDGPGSRDVVFAWMDADKWASWMKSMYGIKGGDLPAVVITDHQKLIYYDKDAFGNKIKLESQSIMDTIDGIQAGQLSYGHSENFVERIARRLNDSLTKLEEVVVAHPYRTGLFFLFLLVAFVIAIRRFIAEDIPSYTDYTRNQKAPSRLD